MNFFTFVFATIIGIAALYFSYSMIGLYFKVQRWDKTECRVISKKMELHSKYTAGHNTPYAIRVEYSYVYGNKNYNNHCVYLVELLGGQANHSKTSADKVLLQIKETMPLYVNPKNPQQSVLFCSGIGLYIFLFCIGVFGLLIGIGYLWKAMGK